MNAKECKKDYREAVLDTKKEIKEMGTQSCNNKVLFKDCQRRGTYTPDVCAPYVYKARVTALLNFYHRIRGSTYAHGYKLPTEHWPYNREYKAKWKELIERYGATDIG